jgi:D-aminoacyl-tRNA deacylase
VEARLRKIHPGHIPAEFVPKFNFELGIPMPVKLPPMRALIQRVTQASVTIDGTVKGSIQQGLLILLGIEEADTSGDIEWLSGKIVRLRVFNDETGVMNRSVIETNGGILLISQFTLFASTKKGNRPSYSQAARPETAIPLYEQFLRQLSQDFGKDVQTGEFGADMKVALTNDGPVTLMIDSKKRE